jgi:hypothetical protein
MRNYNLKIAGYNIGFEAAPNGPELKPSAKYLRNINDNNGSDILIRVHSEPFYLPKDAERVFRAPYVEEINGIKFNNETNFWSVWKYKSALYIWTIFPLSSTEKNAVLKFSLTSMEWDLWIYGAQDDTDPLEYPLDGLILYYITVINGDIMIHASGVTHSGHGYLFSGVSGKGKSTMAKLWDDTGARIIHDDRLIIRNISGNYVMFNTPVYDNDSPSESTLNRIYLIEHGIQNKAVNVKGATAVSFVMANCIQHNWNPEIIAGMMGSVSIMCSHIPVVKLSFKPDRSIIDYILDYE